MQRLLTIARWCLYGTVLVPLVIDSSVFFPFAFPKLALFRTLVELALACVALAAAWAIWKKQPLESIGLPSRSEVWRAAKSPLGISTILFLGSMIVSMFFSTDLYRAFWGDIERGEGVIGLLHVILFGGLLLALFRERDWSRYLKGTLVIGFVLLLYGFFQYLGINWLPLARQQASRIESFTGNSAFLATHILFVGLFAWLVWRLPETPTVGRRWTRMSPSTVRLFWRWLAGVTFVLGFIDLFLTGTRGALVGLGTGAIITLTLLAFRRAPAAAPPQQRRIRTFSRWAIAALFVVAAIFWMTRSASVWQSVPGLDRLARTAESSLSDGSTQTRLITWRISWQSFLEKPLVGWGPEQYITAYERHYDPTFAYYGETWLDRAHNKVFDLLVAQGVVGFLTYFSILVSLSVLIWRRFSGTAKAVLIGFLACYLVQNLFLFDQVISYLTFALLVTWLARRDLGSVSVQVVSAPEVAPPAVIQPPFRKYGSLVVSCLLFVAAMSGVYFVNLLPYAQARAYKESPGLGDVEKVIARLKDSMYPVTFAQKDIRSVGIDNVYQDQYFFYDPYRQNPKFKGVGDLLLAGAKEMIDREPTYDVRVYIRYVTLLHAMARDDMSYYAKAEPYLRTALTLSPTRQELYYMLAFNLAGQGKTDESVAIARQGVVLDPRIGRAHFHLALMLDTAGQKDEAKRELVEMERLDPSLNMLMSTDFRTLGMLYVSLGEHDKLTSLVNRSMRGEISIALDQDTYTSLLKRYAEERDAAHFIEVAKFMKVTFLEFADDMDVLIDLAEKGNWEIIQKL